MHIEEKHITRKKDKMYISFRGKKKGCMNAK